MKEMMTMYTTLKNSKGHTTAYTTMYDTKGNKTTHTKHYRCASLDRYYEMLLGDIKMYGDTLIATDENRYFVKYKGMREM